LESNVHFQATPLSFPEIAPYRDLILSKLVWALDSNSELQQRDVRRLLAGAVDLDYIRNWAPQLGVEKLLDELRQ
jgi:hypothetical protein